MFLLGHALLPAGLVYVVQRTGRLAWLDLRFVMLGGVLPDLIDKPLTLFVVHGVKSGHWVAHSLLFGLVLLALALALRARVPALLPLALGALTHPLLDRLWVSQMQVWFWPFLGDFPAGKWGDPLAVLTHSPWMLAGEVAGAAVLLVLLVRERLLHPERLRAFVASGKVPAADEA